MCCKATGWIGVAAGVATLVSVVAGDAVARSMEANPGAVATVAAGMAAGFQDAQAEASMTADEVLQRAVEAAYGDTAQDRSVKRVRMTGSFEMPSQGISGTVETMIDTERGEMITKTEIPGMMSAQQGITGGVAWSDDTMQGPRLLNEEERAQLARQGDFYADVDFTETYSEREYLGEEELDGVRCHVVSLTPADTGSPLKRWYSAETGLQVQQEFTVASPMGEVTAISRTEGWLDVDGVKMPARTVNSFAGIEQVMAFDSLELNPDFNDDIFATPKGVQELLDQRDAGEE